MLSASIVKTKNLVQEPAEKAVKVITRSKNLHVLHPVPIRKNYYMINRESVLIPISFLPSAAASTSNVQLPFTGLQERMSPLLASHSQRRPVRGLRARAGVRERVERVVVACLLPIELLGTVRGELIEGSWGLSWWSELEESFTIVQ